MGRRLANKEMPSPDPWYGIEGCIKDLMPYQGPHTCDVFISHAGQDTGMWVGWLWQELQQHGLRPFLDEDPDCIPLGADWQKTIWKAAWSCSVFIVLLSPHFFRRTWPVLELRIASMRSLSSAQKFTAFPVYAGWSREEARRALQQARANCKLQVKDGQGRSGSLGACLSDMQSEHQEALGYGPEAKAHSSLLQIMNKTQQPSSSADLHISRKLTLPKLVTELVRRAQRIIPRHEMREGMIARERLVSALSQKLMEAQAAHCWLGLWGKPGLGKSLLASALRAELQHEFPGRTCLLELPHLESTAPLVLGQDIIQDALRQLGAAKRADIQQVLQQEPLLLVLDNVGRHSLPVIQPFLTADHCQGSLLLATARDADAFQQLTCTQFARCNPRVAAFSALPMAPELLLQQEEARQLFERMLQKSRELANQDALPAEQLTEMAASAAVLLASEPGPPYMPPAYNVLCECAWHLGRHPIADAQPLLDHFSQQLRIGEQPSAPDDVFSK